MSPRTGKLAFVVALPLTMLLTYGEAAVHTGYRPEEPQERAMRPPAAPRPEIVPRAAWHAARPAGGHADRAEGVRAVFIHHTDSGNHYACDDVPGMLRSLQADHVRDNGWDDVGYNFLVDRCGRIYEGRAGSLAGPVTGAHTKGFNRHTLGIAAIGNFDGEPVPRVMLQAIAAVIAWKLQPGTDPRGKVALLSSNSESRFRKGTWAHLAAISAHRDAYATDCPGHSLYGRLPWLREKAERLRTAPPHEQRAAEGPRHTGR